MDYSQALAAAIAASEAVVGTTSPNPPVGAAVCDANGEIVGVGATQPPGGPHAEVMALRQAGERARGGTAVVTLEPCNHTGRTGPCTAALVAAGVAEVAYVHSDPNAAAAGGAESLRRAGVTVTQLSGEVPTLRPWLRAVRLGRPHITWKTAHTLDGFTAALDGTSKWITGEAARQHAHRDRARRDAIIVGTGTALADHPQLTARAADGTLYPHQPLRVVVGKRSVPGDYLCYTTIDECMHELWDLGCRDVLLEGGATLATAFLQAGLVDAIHAYIAPALLGAGRGVLTAAVGASISDAKRYHMRSVTQLGDDVFVELGA